MEVLPKKIVLVGLAALAGVDDWIVEVSVAKVAADGEGRAGPAGQGCGRGGCRRQSGEEGQHGSGYNGQQCRP